MSSIYHILDKIPPIHAEEIQIEYENLAIELIKSGRLCIDTDYYCNFVRYSDPTLSNVNIILTIDELTDAKLLSLAKQDIKNLYLQQNKHISEEKLSSIIASLIRETKKLLPVDSSTTTRLARILVQSAHPIVIRWLLLDRTQIFITYSHTIGDVMDISNWKRSGTNSGMQSTDGNNVCVYVSCGGDPFGKNNENNPFYGDGWAALARLQIIAAQELGHYADIKRNALGQQIGRHSANFACTKATPHVKQGRKNDITRCTNLFSALLAGGMERLLVLEGQLQFYDKQKISGLKIIWLKLLIKYYKHKFVKFALANNYIFVKKFLDKKYISIMIKGMIYDMLANLSPEADVYKRSNEEAEEAIACVEALARVPQQIMKWGYLTTRATMHDLYNIYYGEVIPSLIENYELYTGRKYKRNYHLQKISALGKVLRALGLNKSKSSFTAIWHL